MYPYIFQDIICVDKLLGASHTTKLTNPTFQEHEVPGRSSGSQRRRAQRISRWFQQLSWRWSWRTSSVYSHYQRRSQDWCSRCCSSLCSHISAFTSSYSTTQPVEDGSSAHKNSPVRDGVSFVDVIRSSPPESSLSPSQRKESPVKNSSLEHRRSPDSADACKRCLRTGHSANEYRHQLTCRRYCGAGHFAARYPLRPLSKNPKHASSQPNKTSPSMTVSLKPTRPLLHIPSYSSRSSSNSLRVSLPISEVIIK